MTKVTFQPIDPSERLSFGQAARLTGLPKAYLRELADAGQLAVFQVREDGEPRSRISSASLVNAGLLPSQDEQVVEGEVTRLLALLREQDDRIAELEDQRFQLGVQLGSALERIAQLEQRRDGRSRNLMTGIMTSVAVRSAQSLPAGANSTETLATGRLRDVASKLTGAGQRSARIGSSLIRGKSRGTDQSHSSAAAD